MMLEMMGFKVYLAKNGKEAVQEFKSNINSIQLVILDIIMPKLDGQQAFRIIKSLKPEVKVLFASGYYTESILKNMLKGGDALYVVKPFTFEDLLQKVQDLLNHG
jgi:DNA-binding response OmpR family regulator